jgi:hypothetical protein
MSRLRLIALSLSVTLFCTGCQTSATTGVNATRSAIDTLFGVNFDFGQTVMSSLSVGEISDAFRQALQIGSGAVTQKLGRQDGFRLDQFVRIPLPPQLASAQGQLKKLGISAPLDDLETKLNRAAEAAMPHAKAVFVKAVSDLTFQDVMDIYKGPPDSATAYFKKSTSGFLAEKIKPIARDTIATAGAFQAYDALAGRYPVMAVLPDPKNSLTDYVTQKSLDGVFYYLAQEEAAIRQDPIRHTTALLKKVFGAYRAGQGT